MTTMPVTIAMTSKPIKSAMVVHPASDAPSCAFVMGLKTGSHGGVGSAAGDRPARGLDADRRHIEHLDEGARVSTGRKCRDAEYDQVDPPCRDAEYDQVDPPIRGQPVALGFTGRPTRLATSHQVLPQLAALLQGLVELRSSPPGATSAPGGRSG
jgi:hypothetical protein